MRKIDDKSEHNKQQIEMRCAAVELPVVVLDSQVHSQADQPVSHQKS
jgi:hypothetical protein